MGKGICRIKKHAQPGRIRFRKGFHLKRPLYVANRHQGHLYLSGKHGLSDGQYSGTCLRHRQLFRPCAGEHGEIKAVRHRTGQHYWEDCQAALSAGQHRRSGL